MNEFIKEFGKDNFVIIAVIVGIIVVVLIAIVILERRNSRKIIRKEIDNITSNDAPVIEAVHSSPIIENVQEEEPEVLEEDNSNEDKVYYAPNDTTVEEAKEKLEEVTKRLIDDSNKIDSVKHNNFELEQEEKSIISYDELVRNSHDIDQKNDKLLEDEQEAAITLEELYNKHQEKQEIIDGIDSINEKVRVSNPIFEEEPKKFKNSDVISPVFGVYTGKVKPKTVLKEIDKKVGPKDLEDEIQRTEDFLAELKRLKNKLD